MFGKHIEYLTQSNTVRDCSDVVLLCTVPAVDEFAVVGTHILFIGSDHTFVEQPTNAASIIKADRYE